MRCSGLAGRARRRRAAAREPSIRSSRCCRRVPTNNATLRASPTALAHTGTLSTLCAPMPNAMVATMTWQGHGREGVHVVVPAWIPCCTAPGGARPVRRELQLHRLHGWQSARHAAGAPQKRSATRPWRLPLLHRCSHNSTNSHCKPGGTYLQVAGAPLLVHALAVPRVQVSMVRCARQAGAAQLLAQQGGGRSRVGV